MMSKITVVMYSENPVWLQKTASFFVNKDTNIDILLWQTASEVPKHVYDCLIIRAKPTPISLKFAKNVLEIQPKATILWICDTKNADMLLDFLKIKSCSIIRERSSPHDILYAIKNLQIGYIQIPQKLYQDLISTEKPLKIGHIATKFINIYALTRREVELLHLLAKGLLYKEIAKKMGVKLGSVKQYTHIVYTKLGVSNRTEALNRLFSVK